MKTIKRISALLLAVLLMAGLSISAFATIEYVSNVPGEGEGNGVAQTGVLDGTGTVIYQDGSGTNHSLDVSGGAAATPETGPNSPGGTVIKPDTGPDEIDDLVQNAISDDLLKPNGQGGVSDPLNGNGQETPSDDKPTITEQVHVSAITKDNNYGTIDANVSVDADDVAAVSVVSEYGHTASVTITGDVSSVSGRGIKILAEDDGKAYVTVNGTVSSDNNRGVVIVSDYSSDVELTIGDGVSGGTEGVLILAASNSSTAVPTVNINGDVSGGECGISITTGSAVILVTGTVSSADRAFYNASSGKNTELTVWAVDGDIVDLGGADIYYIVQVEQPAEGGTVEALKEDGSKLDKHHELPTAQSGDTICFVVSPKKGYKVTGATNGKDGNKVDLTMIGDNMYSYPVTSAGGIYLAAIFEKTNDSAAKPAAPTYCTLSFDLGGGTIDGKSEYKLSAVFGQKIELPTPVKDGATFKGWKTIMNGDEVILEAGAEFTVKGAASFSAIWE